MPRISASTSARARRRSSTRLGLSWRWNGPSAGQLGLLWPVVAGSSTDAADLRTRLTDLAGSVAGSWDLKELPYVGATSGKKRSGAAVRVDRPMTGWNR